MARYSAFSMILPHSKWSGAVTGESEYEETNPTTLFDASTNFFLKRT